MVKTEGLPEMMQYFEFRVKVLDDHSFNVEEMTKNVKEALEIHLEAYNVKVELLEATQVIAKPSEDLVDA